MVDYLFQFRISLGKIINIDPKYTDACCKKGIALKELERYDEAIQCYDQAINIDPKYTLAYHNKGSALQ